MLNNKTNRNRFYKKRKNHGDGNQNDMSNNSFVPNKCENNRKTRIINYLQPCNDQNITNVFKYMDDINKNNINRENNINQTVDCNTMVNTPPTKQNKLITCLDNINNIDSNNKYTSNHINNNGDKVDREKTDLLLRILLKQSERDFFEKFNSPCFSGIPYRIPLQIKNNIPSIDEGIKNTEIITKEQITVTANVENLRDLIELCDKYPLADNIEYNINMSALHKIKPSMLELQEMIGMRSIKENIVDQILYFVQDLHNISPNNSDYMHTVICGPPGTGKTEVAKIMGKIFSNLGMLKNNVFKKVTRDDLVAGFLGQTAIKTKDVIKETLGGVLFIDEAYALGNTEKRDSFSKECIDTICEALSDHKKDLMCIIAGYENELKDCFFSYNTGLESRFTWKFNIDEYSANELMQIFEKKIHDCGWKLREPIRDTWFEKNKEYFKYFGRDMETLFSKVKIAHSRRVFCLPTEERTKISMEDLEKGFAIYKQMGSNEKRIEEQARLKQIYSTIYC
jgi:AAA+ superfamily predicted ATPase